MRIPFLKTQTVGNDFVLVRESDVLGVDLGELAVATSDRRRSVGHDGLLVVGQGVGHVRVQFFNPDGTEDFCGNGLRCSGLFAVNECWAQGSFELWQNGVVIPCTVFDGVVSTQMPAVEMDPQLVPIVSESPWIEREVQGVVGTAVSTGSTHFVVFVDELPLSPDFESLSEAIENDVLFPQRTSVMWTRIVGDRSLEIRIWERGVGETLGCGTGAIASAVVYSRMSGVVGAVSVVSQGGTLVVELTGWDAPVLVSSSPIEVFEGNFEFNP